ncbi:GntR family transcriptional regulator [Streptomyces beihaiensis]|uniref:GntR family transcriptional regulator n=1 Tax=Streptomyces beihaiensis TaxID=2984495 RepID=A0ABT3U282_9ACTN|nr:GntR family transcriptional regulator [Streptomyces beihaiensis]MCX3063389.1 GntR family transcriptional regulator [Streptomyces beihaiensis]
MASAKPLRPVKREPAATIIAAQLTEAIMTGVLAPGTQLGEAELAGQLGVSRGPLREALQRLVQQGIAVSAPHRGVFVTQLDEDDIRDIYFTRTAMESAACKLVLRGDPQRTADRLAKIHRTMASAARRGNLTALSAADMELHQTLVEESGSPRLRRIAETLFVETRMCLSALTDIHSDPDSLVAEHAALIEALRAADEPRLLALLDDHMQDAVQRLTRAAREDGDGDVEPEGEDGVGAVAG